MKKDRDMLAVETGRLLEKKVLDGSVSVDFGGHFYSPEDAKEAVGRHLGLALLDSDRRSISAIKAALLSGDRLTEPVRITGSCLWACPKCGKDISFLFDNRSLTADPCDFRELPEITVVLNVPSGKLAVANDLRRFYPMTGDYYVNHFVGILKTMHAYAEIGLAHGFVGNSCPSLYRIDARHLAIGVKGTRGGRRNVNPVDGAKAVAHICTDLWWYSISDLDDLLSLSGGELPKDVTVVNVDPGVYRIRHLYHLLYRSEGDEAQVFARIERIRKPDPVSDLRKAGREKSFTAGQVIAHAMERRADRGLSRYEAIRQKADHILCVIGNGYDFHPNGWLGTDPDMDGSLPDLKIPAFRGPYNWYPLCDYSALAAAAGLGRGLSGKGESIALNESFARLAFNIVRSMLVYGVETYKHHDSTPASIEKERQRQLRWAWHIYLGLRKRYPAWIPKDCLNLPKPGIPKIDALPK